jgi:hypothetical protein
VHSASAFVTQAGESCDKRFTNATTQLYFSSRKAKSQKESVTESQESRVKKKRVKRSERGEGERVHWEIKTTALCVFVSESSLYP